MTLVFLFDIVGSALLSYPLPQSVSPGPPSPSSCYHQCVNATLLLLTGIIVLSATLRVGIYVSAAPPLRHEVDTLQLSLGVSLSHHTNSW